MRVFSMRLALAALLLLPQVALAQNGRGEEVVKGIQVLRQSGAMRLGRLDAFLIHFNDNWAPSSQQGAVEAAEGFPKSSDAGWALDGTYKTVGGGAFAFQQRIERIDARQVRYTASFTSADPVPTNALAVSLSLPTDSYAGREIVLGDQAVLLPAELTETGIAGGQYKSLVIPTSAGRLTISGALQVFVQDDRRWGANTFAVRISCDPGSGAITRSGVEFTVRLDPYEFTSIDIGPAANMGFGDATAGDNQGGWTDQGPENDLSMLESGSKAFGGVSFSVINPASTGGKSAIVLGGGNQRQLPARAGIPVGAGSEFAYLYFLHASAWTPADGRVGTLTVRYTDGADQKIDILSNRDAPNWWGPTAAKNAAVVFTAENKSSIVGLYLSKFPVDANRTIRELILEGTPQAAWMIVGISGSNDSVPLPMDSPVYLVVSDQWQPIEHRIDVEPGSALDFSFLVDGPAGKHGHVQARGGHFEFADRPGVPVRFYGANLCFSANFIEKPEAEKLAERLARIGYNTMRLHHYDWDLVEHDAQNSYTLNPGQIDKLDYLIHCLKQKGIYVNIDLYTFRETKAAEIPEVNRPIRDGYKALVPILPSARANWQNFAKALLTHKNPYTGMTLAEDPVLMGICPLNEDPLAVNWDAAPDIRKLYVDRFEAWLKEQNRQPADEQQRQAALGEFLSHVHRKADGEYFQYLRSLGVKAPLTGVNVVNAIMLTPVRDQYDYVDNHEYWDHPGFPERPWSLPHRYSNQSATKAAADLPRAMMPTRIPSKPFTVTEWNYTFPNRYRAEGGALMGAYSSLQNWNALWRFAYSHSRNNAVAPQAGGGFDIGTDPLSLLSERLGVLLFLRGDVSPARQTIPYIVTRDNAYPPVSLGWGSGGFPQAFGMLGLHTGIGSVWLEDGRNYDGAGFAFADPAIDRARLGQAKAISTEGDLIQSAADAGAVDGQKIDVKGAIESDTGQLQISPTAGTFKLATPRSEAFVFAGPGEMSGASVKAGNEAGFAVVSVSALDDQPLATSRRMLVLHMTDVQNNKIKYRDQAMQILETFGEMPHIVRRGATTIRIDGAGGAEVWAIDMSGKRTAKVDAQVEGGALVFKAETIRGERQAAMAYELVKP